MKFSIVALSCFTQLALYGREEALSFAIDEGDARVPVHELCSSDNAKRYVAEADCIPAGFPNIKQFVCEGCDPGRAYVYIPCEFECCDPTTGTLNHGCKCTPAGKSYRVGKNPDDPSKCCGKGAGNGTCGCSAVGSFPKFGGSASDCCSGQWSEDWHQCEKRTCTKKNNEGGSCCRVSDGSSPMSGGKCGCFHGNQSPHADDDVDGTNCCTGSLNPTTGTCGCIEDHNTPLPDGWNKHDCCSGATETHDGGEYCRAAACSEVGSAKIKGHFCCSGKESDGKCACISSGEAATQEGRNCCSGRAKGGKCAHLRPGERPNLNVTDESVCASGKVDAEGKCLCIHAGSPSIDAEHCCSGAHEADSDKCSCAPISHDLVHGATVSDCCSGTAKEGTCSCAAPGAPVRKDLGVRECCAKHASDHGDHGHCGCSGPEDTVSAEHAGRLCCGGFFDGKQSKCACIKAGYAVASFVPAASCCSGHKSVVHGRHVCT